MPFPIDIKYIIETEKELGVIFPDRFKAKMINENGGELLTDDDNDWKIFPFFDKSDKKRLSRTSDHIISETKYARSWGNFPRNGVAVASNGSGDFLILLPTKNDKKLNDEIFIWFHETGKVEKVANSVEEINPSISRPLDKPQVKKQKLNSLKTSYGFCLDKVPSPWILIEKILNNNPVYTFQIGKGTDCIVSLQTSFPTEQFENDKYWLDLWISETELNYNLEGITVERSELDNYSCIVVKSKKWIPVLYWFKNTLTDKWYLKMKTGQSRHNGDFKEFTKLLNSIRRDEQ